MIPPKEKATELFYKFNGFNTYGLDKECCKKSSQFLCDEIINILDEISIAESGRTKIDYGQSDWRQVKEEINKI